MRLALWFPVVAVLIALLLPACGPSSGNRAPKIQEITAVPSVPTHELVLGNVIDLTCTATDADGDPLTYTWTLRYISGPHNQGTLTPTTGPTVRFYTGDVTEARGTTTAQIAVTVQDSYGAIDRRVIEFTIRDPS